VHAPARGYLIDGGFAQVVAPILDRHGLRHEPMPVYRQ
jgi:hypothetical protein